MPLFKKLTVMLAKIEASYGRATGAGSTATIIDTNQTWVADGVKVGDAVVYKPLTANQEVTYITNISAGTNTITFSPVLAGGATADGDLYEIMVDGGLAANEQSMSIAGTADAGSNTTTIIDAALNANDGFAHQGIKTGHQVYITGGGGLGGSGVITAIDHDTHTLTITTITGVTTGSTFIIRPTPVLLFDVGHKFPVDMYERNPLRSSFTPLVKIPGKRMSTITCSMELTGGTSWANFAAGTPGAGNLPPNDVFIRACGFLPTIVAATSVTYNPISRGVPALTIATYEDGIQKISLGCRGTATIEMNTGEPPKIMFTLTGVPKEVSSSLIDDVAFPDGVIYPGIIPPVCQGVTINAYAFILNAISFDLGNTVGLRPSMAAAAGYLSTVITNRAITGSFDPEMVKQADHDFYGNLIGGTLVELNAVAGATAGNILQIGSPDNTTTAQYTEVDSDSDRELARVAATNLAFVSTTEEAEFAIKIT